MRLRFSSLSSFGFSVAVGAVLMSSGRAMAQSNDGEVPAILTGVFFFCALLMGLAFYVYMALALQTIAKKTGTADDWLAWIPIANLFLLVNVARKPLWWVVLFFIPLVNIVMAVIVWMAVAQARRKPDWWGILIIVPVANLIVPGYLAWSD